MDELESWLPTSPVREDKKKPQSKMEHQSGLKGLVRDAAKLRTAAVETLATQPGPGRMATNMANVYMANIANLFNTVDRAQVELSLCIWGILHGVGGQDDFAVKPNIEAGGISVNPTEIFGRIIPVGVDGKPRQFMTAYFEEFIPSVLDAVPELRTLLAPRVAKAGLKPGQEALVIDFNKGTTAGTQGMAGERQRAKDMLIGRQAASGRIPGSADRVPPPVREVTFSGVPSGGHEPSLY